MDQNYFAKLKVTEVTFNSCFEPAELKPIIEEAAITGSYVEVSPDWLTSQTDLELEKRMIHTIRIVSEIETFNKKIHLQYFLSFGRLKCKVTSK